MSNGNRNETGPQRGPEQQVLFDRRCLISSSIVVVVMVMVMMPPPRVVMMMVVMFGELDVSFRR